MQYVCVTLYISAFLLNYLTLWNNSFSCFSMGNMSYSLIEVFDLVVYDRCFVPFMYIKWLGLFVSFCTDFYIFICAVKPLSRVRGGLKGYKHVGPRHNWEYLYKTKSLLCSSFCLNLSVIFVFHLLFQHKSVFGFSHFLD